MTISKKKFVLSGANIYYGGNLTIYYEILNMLVRMKTFIEYDCVIFVHRKEDFIKYNQHFTIIELPKERKSYLNRIKCEYIYYKKYSKENDIHIWFSLNDFTPNVVCEKQYTYCHNPLPFYKMRIRDIKYDLVSFVMTHVYQYVYRINLKRTIIIVQQEWIRDIFIKKYGADEEKVYIARPYKTEKAIENVNYDTHSIKKIIYPVYPRFFKNIELVCKACAILEKQEIQGFEMLFTMDGKENRYAAEIYRKYSNIKSIKFIGQHSKSEIIEIYKECYGLIFASKLETWGLAISEFKDLNKPMLLVDLPYARETIGEYTKVNFFDEDNEIQLAGLIKSMITENSVYQGNCYIPHFKSFSDWEELLKKILEDCN